MAFPKVVLVYEFFTGGGFPEGELPGGLAAEALGMLWALLADFRRWGEVRTITALDTRFEERIPGLNRETLPADEVVCVLPREHEEVYLSLLKRCDAALIVAPETNGILAELTARAEMAGVPLLGSSASAAALAGDKAGCSLLIFPQMDLPAPKTHIVSLVDVPRAAEEMGYPLVIKPIDGAGSEGVYRIGCLSDLRMALPMIRRVTSHEHILLQSLADGIHASVSLLVTKDRRLPLSLNRQLMKAGLQFQYLGSQVPFYHNLGECALNLACNAASLIPGLNGYVGVDLVLGDDEAQLIEVNPRLTTSYIGLRQVAQINLAQAIWNGCRLGELPNTVPLIGQVVIKKEDCSTWGLGLCK
jgi:tyramine---L-glutamate ligase